MEAFGLAGNGRTIRRAGRSMTVNLDIVSGRNGRKNVAIYVGRH